MKNMKKLTALLLTLVMSLALAVPCFAAEPPEDAVWLKVGESYTVGGYTITIKEDTRTPAERAAERQALLREAIARGQQIGDKYYYLKAVEYHTPTAVQYTANCVSSRGDTLHYIVENYDNGNAALTFSLQVGNEVPVNTTVACGQTINPEVYAEKSVGIRVPVESKIYAGGKMMWFSTSIYQYWR